MADLTTVGNVKAYAQITDNSQDAVLARLVSAFSAWFLNQINRGALISATYTENRNGQGGDSITLNNWPITAITSLSVDGNVIPASPGPGQFGYVFDPYSLWIVAPSGCSSRGSAMRFNKGRGNVQIVYVAGYASVPLDVEQAVIDQVLWTLRRQPNLGTVSQQMNGITTVSFSQKDMAPGVSLVIENYKDKTVVGA